MLEPLHSAADYDAFMRDHFVPAGAQMYQELGHDLPKAQAKLVSHAAPMVTINSHSGDMELYTGAIDTLQGKNLNGLSRETKAVLSHEIAGHYQKFGGKTAGMASIIAAPVIAIGAYDLLKHQQRKHMTDEERTNAILNAQPDSNSIFSNPKFLSAAKYVAIGALGLAAGGAVARQLSRGAEFAADRRALELTKDPEALVSALEKLHKRAEHMTAEAISGQKGISEWLNIQMQNIKNMTIDAHPSLGERTDYIRSIAEQHIR